MTLFRGADRDVIPPNLAGLRGVWPLTGHLQPYRSCSITGRYAPIVLKNSLFGDARFLEALRTRIQ